METKHQAIAAGLALTLAFGGAQLPTPALADAPAECASADSAAAASGDGELPEPAAYDKGDFYDAGIAEASISTFSLRSARSGSLLPSALSSEMKYFAQNESGSNYDQGFSYGDGYNALGFYQFDRRYSLIGFLQGCYEYNSTTYAMFAPVLARAAEVSDGSVSMYDSSARKLTELGQLVNDAWHAAYIANPTEFAALQDSYAYNQYYLPVERLLRNKYGVDISGRSDCVKGLFWGLCNLFGQGGCQKFLDIAGLSDDMTDSEMVSAVCDAVINNVARLYPSQPQYHQGWTKRYEREKQACLDYIAQHEAATPPAEETPGEQPPVEEPPADEPSTDEPEGDSESGEGDADEEAPAPDNGDAPDDDAGEGDGNDGGSDTGNDAVMPPSGDDSSSDDAEKPSDIPAEEEPGQNPGGADGDARPSDPAPGPESGNPGGDEAPETPAVPGPDEFDEGDDSTGDDDTGKAPETDGSADDGFDGGASGIDASEGDSGDSSTDADNKKEPVLPQTGDATALIAAVSGGLAGLGAVSTFAGAMVLKRRDDERHE